MGGFPAWYQDESGVAFDFCAPETQAELDGGWCLLLPGDANIPVSAAAGPPFFMGSWPPQPVVSSKGGRRR